MKKTKDLKEKTRKARVRSKVFGTSERPRLAVRITNAHIYAQLIDDTKGEVLASASDLNIKEKNTKPTEIASMVGTKIAALAKEKKIKKVVFDRGASLYHGKTKALAEAARKDSLEF